MKMICKIEELCTKICSGGTPKSTIKDYYGGNIPWLNTAEINFNRINKTEKTLTELGLSNSSAKWIPADSVIIAMYGNTAGKVAVTTIPITTNQACCNLVVDEKKCDYRYLYYYLVTQYPNLVNLSVGGAQQNLNAKTIRELPIDIPPIEVQKKIAGLLWILDSKIMNTQKINDNLSEQAQSIFNELIINGESISEGKLTDIAHFQNGLPMQKNRPISGDGLPVLKIKELGQGHCDNSSERCREDIDSSVLIDNGDVVFSWSGSLMAKIWCGGKCGLNQHLFKVTSTKYPLWFYYYWLQYHMPDFIDIAANKATTMGHICRNHLEGAIVSIPGPEVMKKADSILSPLVDSLIKSMEEITQLTELRDYLLPKLMSGEIDVSTLEIPN